MKFYVYAYFRENGTPCYIGKGTSSRWIVHERLGLNKHLAGIIKLGKYSRKKIAENLTNEEAYDLEALLIRLVGREINGGPLINQTDGGQRRPPSKREGAPRTVTEETKAKIRAAKLGNTCALGYKHSEEAKSKIRQARLGRKMSDESRQKISMAFKGTPWSEARRQAYENRYTK